MTRLFAVVAAALTIGAFVTPVASAAPIKLVLAPSVDNSTRLISKPFSITLTLTNQTDQPLNGVKVNASTLSGSNLSVSDWNGLANTRPNDPGVTIGAGTTRSFTLTASVSTWKGNPLVRFKATMPKEYQQTTDLTVPMVDPTTTSGNVAGVVYGDRNGNEAFDEGEELANVPVLLSYWADERRTVTDVDGRFAFADVPARRYSIFASDLPDGWILPYAQIYADVDGTTDATPSVRAIRPLSDTLHAAASFDREVYAPGDAVEVTFTLSNVGSEPVSGISGWCDRYGDGPDHIAGWKSWSDLVWPAKLTLAPGETRTFHEVGTVPAVANQYGGFYAACDFGPEQGVDAGYPAVTPWGKVPGESVDVNGRIYHDDNFNSTLDPGEAIADTAVSLVDVDGQTTATGTTDGDGRMAFAAIPVGPYKLLVDGWVPADKSEFQFTVGTCQGCGGERYIIYKR
ncbi:hypothetical protein AB5J62_30630 [Amycolatopsis sp. cg5]|uniref:hypothetical protein n=1 Tax=Amycolatopsis sp. cg5 TaxID=3238802 RepID=UPI003523CD4F